MGQPAIKPVESNMSKGKTYTYLMSNYKSAMENGYYGEAELIIYAFIEDRLRAFLYYSDAVNSRNSQNINENMVSIYGAETSIKNITDKINVIKTALDAGHMDEFKSNKYAQHLKRIYKISINTAEFKRELNKIRKWCAYRNELVHAMFNKDIEALRSGYKEHVEEGYRLGRYIDAQVQTLKRT